MSGRFICAPKLRTDADLTSIEMDMNNRNAENRSELKTFDLSIEEINNKFTISLGDLRTEIESAKWDATRRAICTHSYFLPLLRRLKLIPNQRSSH